MSQDITTLLRGAAAMTAGQRLRACEVAAEEIERLRAQRLALVAALREARAPMCDGEIAYTFDVPGTRGEATLLAAFTEADQ